MSSEMENGYTFRMGDHEITLRDSFSSMLDSNQLTDCLLVASTHLKDADGQPLTNGHTSPVPAKSSRSDSDQIVRTHRVILSASSDYFRSMFATVPNTHNNGVVAVVVPNVDFEDLQAIVDFIYKGQVSVGQSRIHKFLAAAQLLMVKGLMNIKLVTNDEQPADDHSDKDAIQRLKNEKRLLEEKIQAIKEKEWIKTERMKHEIETEMKKKYEIERNILSEEKQRFEAEKMKFTIEKEMYEKNKNNQSNTNKSNATHKPIIVNIGRSILGESLSKSAEKDKLNSIASTSETPKTGPTNAGTSNSTAKSYELKSTNSSETSTPEPEGRVLRKRIRLSDINENDKQQYQLQQSANKSKTNDDDDEEEDQRMEVEEEDGEVYEVDFSQAEGMDESLKNDRTEDSKSDSPDKGQKSFHRATDTPTTTPSQISTRSLRRSTSSIGSASTQSVGGENGIDGESGMSLRRKGPGRTPNHTKNGDNTESGGEGTPVTRNKSLLQKVSGEEPAPVGIKQSANSTLYTCPYCPQVYHGNQSMQDHINGVHLNQKTQYICDHCGKVYTWRISLNKHLRTMHPDAPIPE